MSALELPPPDVGAFYSDRLAGEIFGRSREFVQRTCRAKVWPHTKIGSSYRFTPDQVRAIAALCTVEPDQSAGAEATNIWGLAPGRRSA